MLKKLGFYKKGEAMKSKIENLFYKEFGHCKELFQIVELSYQEALSKKDAPIYHPGVYIWVQ